MNFIDEVKIYTKSGDGGDGCFSFRREKFVPLGGPDGGNGGNGGSIKLLSDKNLSTLSLFRKKSYFVGNNGEKGKNKCKFGANAEDLIIKVPVGTQIIDELDNIILFDFVEDSQEYLLLKGGKGGVGNLRSKRGDFSREFTKGHPGREGNFILRLKLFADVGIIGLPNAGKSTLINACSNAKSKIADYEFTTLSPVLGAVKIGFDGFVIADIPGLIEDAHKGVGLGIKFLQHIERCKILLHIIDITGDITSSYNIIDRELKSYGRSLKEKKEILVLNKIDQLSEEEVIVKLKGAKEKLQKEIYLISGINRNLGTLLVDLLDIVKDSNH